MSKVKRIIAVMLTLSILAAKTFAQGIQNDSIPKKLITFTKNVLIPVGTNPTIIQAVTAQNTATISLQDIKIRDQEWKSTPGVNKSIMNLLSNDCALELLNLQKHYKFIVESFATDKQGALVAATRKLSDYWQGDEEKFIKSYHNGKGAIHYGPLKFDESANEIIIQISIPVKADGKVIGTLTFGISPDHWETR